MFAEVADIEARLGRPLTPDEASAVSALIGDVSALVKAYCRRSFGRIENDVVELEGGADRELTLPDGPVTEVYRVEIDGTEITEFRRVGDTLWRRWGWQKRIGDVLPSVVKVTYTHGSEVPADVKAVVCNEVLRVLCSAAPGATSETLGEHTLVYEPGSGAISLSRSARTALARYRKRTGSAPLRRP